ncbi:hypothetical protein F8388_024685 [Cannabis sativa]|uniref:Uncharacterized protein n=1 Tax=Cannabis sativa TaxID=3483 RepID=A0A7J6GC43_CANSA|nr:hypothetical protein F8388_024685 [Cannabis sativa]
MSGFIIVYDAPPPKISGPPRQIVAGRASRVVIGDWDQLQSSVAFPRTEMAGNAAKSVVKAVAEYQYPWREKLVKYKNELSKGVWGYWELGAWKPLGLSARRRARLRKEVLLAEQDWHYDPERKEMRTKRKGHKHDRIAAEKRENTARLMEKMPQMLLDYKKRRWEKKMKEEDKTKP